MYEPSSAIKGKQAVFEAHPENAAVKALADLATDAKFDRNELTITVARENIIAVKLDRKSTRLNSSHQIISYAVFCLKKKKVLHSDLCIRVHASLARAACATRHREG